MSLVVSLIATGACACAASTRPSLEALAPESFAAVARGLGATTGPAGCVHGRAPLVDATLAEWGARPYSSAFDADWACLALADGLGRDSMQACAPPTEAVFDRVTIARRISGEHFYVGFDPREYAYDVVPDPRGARVEVRVQFTGRAAANAERIASMQAKLDRAAEFWSEHSPGGSVRFRFRVETSDTAEPHFQLRLYEGDDRTPFDVSWGDAWSWHLLAHEIGHMMGLDDEYGQLKKTLGHALGKDEDWKRDPKEKIRWFGCNPRSLMCDSRGLASTPQPYHYYVILRRRFCRVTQPDWNVPAP